MKGKNTMEKIVVVEYRCRSCNYTTTLPAITCPACGGDNEPKVWQGGSDVKVTFNETS